MTPYDTALRIRRREMDRIKVDIAAAAAQLDELTRKDAEIAARVAAERKQSAAIHLPADAWHARMRAERARLGDARRHADGRLAQLRATAAEAFGAMRALEEAALRHREETTRAAANAEQARLDDAAAARFIREQKA